MSLTITISIISLCDSIVEDQIYHFSRMSSELWLKMNPENEEAYKYYSVKY